VVESSFVSFCLRGQRRNINVAGRCEPDVLRFPNTYIYDCCHSRNPPTRSRSAWRGNLFLFSFPPSRLLARALQSELLLLWYFQTLQKITQTKAQKARRGPPGFDGFDFEDFPYGARRLALFPTLSFTWQETIFLI